MKCRDCRYGCAPGECVREDVDMSKHMFFTIMPLMLIIFVITLYYLISLTQIKYGGVHKLTPDYFEVYNNKPCSKMKVGQIFIERGLDTQVVRCVPDE